MMVRCCFVLMVFAGLVTEIKAQQAQQTKLNPEKIIATEEFSRILVPSVPVDDRALVYSNWQQGAVFLSQGRYASGITFNYDVLNHDLLVQVDDKQYSLNPIAIDSILVANSKDVLINPILLENVQMDVLLLRLHQGPNFSLFRHTLAEVVEKEPNTTSNTTLIYSEKDDTEVDRERLYFLLNKTSNEFSEFYGKKKELKKWQNGGQLIDFVNDSELNLRKETDLIKVVEYYEQLMFSQE